MLDISPEFFKIFSWLLEKWKYFYEKYAADGNTPIYDDLITFRFYIAKLIFSPMGLYDTWYLVSLNVGDFWKWLIPFLNVGID